MQRTLIASLCLGAIMAVKIDSQMRVAASDRLHMEDVDCAWTDDEHRWNWHMDGKHYYAEFGNTYVIDELNEDYITWGAHFDGAAVTEVVLEDEYIFGPERWDILPQHWMEGPSNPPYYYIRGSEVDYYFNADNVAVYQTADGTEHAVDMTAPDAYLH